MKHRDFKDAVYGELGRVAKAIDNPHRLELIDLLAQGERSVEALAGQAALGVANTSRHLQVLKGARLVETRKDGLRVYYRLADVRVFEVVRAIRVLAESRVAQIEQLVQGYLGSRDDLEPVSREDLRRRLAAGDVVLVDVRPAEEFHAGHIRGAISMPIEALRKRSARLPARKEVIAYCRGPYCVMAYDAVAQVRARGGRARRLVDGFPEWRAAGLPVEAGAGGGK
jgi:rhodanese-related sulfurtransferase/DNA-binding transcriptional ArsR family regulator